LGEQLPSVVGSLPRRLLLDRRVLFLLVGGFNLVQGVAWFALLHALLDDVLPYLVILMLAYAPAILIGFTLYRTFVFKVAGHWLRDLFRFTLVQGVAFAINVVSLPFLHEVLGVPLVLAQGISVVVILVFNYMGHLYFSFRRSHGHVDAGHFLEPEALVSDALAPGRTGPDPGTHS